MKRISVLVLGLLAGLVVFASVSSASPGLKLDKKAIGGKQCQADSAKSTELVNVHFTLVNDYDSGFAGNAWANDTIDASSGSGSSATARSARRSPITASS